MRKEKICSFYVSDFHLITILLPYINEKILEEKEIITILQNDVSKSIKRYLKSVKNLNIEKERILDIGWKEIKKMNNSLCSARDSSPDIPLLETAHSC